MARLAFRKISLVVVYTRIPDWQCDRFIKSTGATPVIVLIGIYLANDLALSPKDWHDTKLYQQGHIIGRLFGRLKEE